MPNSESLGRAVDAASIVVEGLPVEQKPRSTTTKLIFHPVQLTGGGSASGVRTDTNRSRKTRELLNILCVSYIIN